MDEKLKLLIYKFERSIELKKYVFNSKIEFIKFLKKIPFERSDLTDFSCEFHNGIYKMNNLKLDEFFNLFEKSESYLFIKLLFKFQDYALYFEIYDLENFRIKTKLKLFSNTENEIERLEENLKNTLNKYLTKLRFLSNTYIEGVFITIIASLIIFKLNIKTNVNAVEILNNILVWIIIFFSVIIYETVNFLIFPTIKIKMKKGLRRKINNFISINKNSIVIASFFFFLGLLVNIAMTIIRK